MIWVALRKELLEQWRSYRVLIVVAVLVAFGLMSPLVAKFTPQILALLPGGEQIAQIIPPPSVAEAIGQYLKNISQFAVLLALLMTMGAVAQEKDKGTAAMMLVKPLPRPAFLAAKFIALGATFALGILLAAAAAYFYTWILFEAMDVAHWLALNGLLLLFVLVYVALTLLCSTVSRSQVAAGGLAFVWLIVLSLMGSLPKVGEYLPGQLLNWGATLMLGAGDAAWTALAVSVGTIVIALVGAWAIFARQEL